MEINEFSFAKEEKRKNKMEESTSEMRVCSRPAYRDFTLRVVFQRPIWRGSIATSPDDEVSELAKEICTYAVASPSPHASAVKVSLGKLCKYSVAPLFVSIHMVFGCR